MVGSGSRAGASVRPCSTASNCASSGAASPSRTHASVSLRDSRRVSDTRSSLVGRTRSGEDPIPAEFRHYLLECPGTQGRIANSSRPKKCRLLPSLPPQKMTRKRVERPLRTGFNEFRRCGALGNRLYPPDSLLLTEQRVELKAASLKLLPFLMRTRGSRPTASCDGRQRPPPAVHPTSPLSRRTTPGGRSFRIRTVT
jgi:hypothetical protein